MDKTVNINLGGSLFQIDEEAFVILRDYLQALNTRLGNIPGGPETIEDIENRIAEIFQSSRGNAGIITRANVEAMISILGKPEDFDLSDENQERPIDSSRKRLYRNPDDSVISGVCGGLGAYFSMDPVLFRILFILFTIVAGVGFIIYITLWIVVPPAVSPSRKKEMYGNKNPENAGRRNPSSSLGNTINEIAGVIGRIFFVIIRIFMITIGVILLIFGFLSIISLVMVFVFKIPGAFSHDGFNFNIGYLPEMMKYIAQPNIAPWIIILSAIVILMPLLALIYWGVRMIFWFRINDKFFNLTAFIIWIAATTSLTILLFNEGISFAEHSSTTSQYVFPEKPDTLYVVTRNRVESIKYDQEFSIPDEKYAIFFIDSTLGVFIKPQINLETSENNTTKIEIKKTSSARTRSGATERSESLIFNNSLSGDTLYIDDYFTIPEGKKWRADFVNIKLMLPEKSVVYFDTPSARLVDDRTMFREANDEGYGYRNYHNTEYFLPGNKYWIYSGDGIKETERKKPIRK